MTVEVAPITNADTAAVAEFLHTNLSDRVPWERTCLTVPWKMGAPNHGFMLRDGQRVVGTVLALYSERLIAGRMERFCNLSSWCVLPSYRSQAISLLKVLLAQEGYHFTVLTPDVGPQEILAWLGFRQVDTAAAFVPNLPWPTLPGRTKVSADPAVIERALGGTALQVYRDHAHALGARHLVVIRGENSCHVMYREFRYKTVPLFAIVMHVSNPELFHRALIPLTRHLLIRHRLMATLVELRMIEHKPRMSFELYSWPKMYRSASLGPAQIDDIYSELTCLPPRGRGKWRK